MRETHICHSGFASIVPDQSRSWSSSTNGGNIDDASSLSLIDQIGNNVASRMEDGFDVHSEDSVELIFGYFRCWLFPLWSAPLLS